MIAIGVMISQCSAMYRHACRRLTDGLVSVSEGWVPLWAKGAIATAGVCMCNRPMEPTSLSDLVCGSVGR